MAENTKISVEQIAKALKQLSEFEEAGKDFSSVGEHLHSAKEAYKKHSNLVGDAKEYLKHAGELQGHARPDEHGVFTFLDNVTNEIKDAKRPTLENANAAAAKFKNFPSEDAKHLETLSGKLGGWFGRVHSQGGFTGAGLKKTLHSNFIGDFKNHKPLVFGRGAVVALGAVGLGDSLFRSTTSDGEDRSLIVRGAELGIGAAAVTLALLVGKAKTLATVAK
ncbi:MAG: hypothetical protein ACK52W_08925 [Alphaproteobacteria bacterium]